MNINSRNKLGAALLVCLLLTFFSFPLQAQHNHSGHSHDSKVVPTVRNCHAMDVLTQNLQRDPGIMQRMMSIEEHTQSFIREGAILDRAVVSIPVVVHVLYRTSSENISDAQILSQIAVLNDDFRRNNADANNKWSQAADSEIEFCLASVDPSGNPTTGITRTSTNKTSFGTNDAMKYSNQGGKDAWPTDQYLNIWVCTIGGGILGYAQFPGSGSSATDGVVVGSTYFGTTGTATAPFNKGRTTTHEVGHWLNLRHIWGGGGCGVDDFVSDTPESDAANYGCASTHSSCGSADMVENYMDYSDDACMNLFTNGQKARMQALFAPGGFRRSLLTSGACGGGSGGGGTTACASTITSFPYSEGFESGLGAWAQSAADNIDWTRKSGSTPSGNTGPSAAAAGTYYMYIEASSPNYPSKTAILSSPCFNMSSLSNPELTFQYHMWGAAMGTLALEVSTNNGSTWTSIWSKVGDQGNAWASATVSLSSYAGQTIQLRFKGTTGSNYTGDMSVDDIKLQNKATTGGGGGGGSTCTGELVSLAITFDNYPAETSWSIVNASGQTVATGNNYTGTSHSQSVCLPDGCYDFVINDSYGDGMCCAYGNGAYSLTDASGGILAAGGSFTTSETTNFCVGGAGGTTCPTIDFSAYSINAYSTQDQGTAQVQDAGQTLFIQNNAWKAIPYNYTVTASTVIEVEFRSTLQGEIHGIGFDNDDAISSDRIFRLHGTQAWGIANYDNYPNNGTWVTYVIPVGSFYTGSFNKLCFVGDHDASPKNANAYFRNVRVYEGSCSGARSVAAAASSPIIQNEGEADFFANLFPNPAKSQLTIQIASKSTEIRGQIIDATGRIVWNGQLQNGNNLLNINDLPAGIYHFSALEGNGKMITLKFVKAH